MDHPLPWLRYVDAGDLDDSSVKLDGMTVESTLAEKLGTVDGFIIDVSSGRPYYVVVDAGGWFKSKFFLLPIGHVGLASTDGTLVADITKDHIDRFPGFDRGEFEKLSDAELSRMDEQIAAACCPSELAERSPAASRFESWKHYRAPSWWDADFYRPDRVDASARTMAGMPDQRRDTAPDKPRRT
jgi:PRC-barrel domain